MPPCFSAACAKSDTASKDNTAAASACPPRIFPSLDGSASFGPIISNDTMTGRGRNQQGPVSILVLRTNAKLSQKSPQEDPSPKNKALHCRLSLCVCGISVAPGGYAGSKGWGLARSSQNSVEASHDSVVADRFGTRAWRRR